MAQITPVTLKQGQCFHTDNRTLYLITDGSLSATAGELTLHFTAGDMPGLLDLFKSKDSFTYQAEDLVTLMPVSVPSLEALCDYLKTSEASRQKLFTSFLQQMKALFFQYEASFYECTSLYETLVSDYRQYVLLCQKYQYPAQSLTGFDKIKAPVKSMDSFLSSYYDSLSASSCPKDSAVLTGLLFHGGLDCDRILAGLSLLSRYQQLVSALYLNQTGNDLLSLNLSLLSRFRPDTEDTEALLSGVRFLLVNLDMNEHTDSKLLGERTLQFEAQQKRLSEAPSATEDSSGAGTIDASLAGSLEQILLYSTLSIEERETLRNLTQQYRELEDKFSSDEGPRRLYQKYTESFLTLYRNVTMKALEDSEIPILVRMFLYFGYLDEDLAGIANARLLYQLAQSYTPAKDSNVYLFFDWMTAIFQGKKEPSRNEFDEEYSAVIHKMKLHGDISAAQEKEYLADSRKKAEYELANMFPQVNKMTYGRISSYCPVFSEHNLLRSLTSSFVTKEKIMNCLQKIRTTDYSAFYRETIYSNPDAGINKDFIHIEVLPDFILMPNAGVRGAMWQEIENRRRTTPARMMLPLFYLDDLDNRLIHLTGEYRWEMCKRIQGGRWNDLTELSLTSEYFDYIQFYRKNNDLSTDAKDKIKNALMKTKNNYKEMFVLDYTAWILYESTGSPRLNKVARNILFTYCPFTKEIRATLEANPIYRDILDRYRIKNAQKVHHLDIVRQKIFNLHRPLPEEIEKEYTFISL